MQTDGRFTDSSSIRGIARYPCRWNQTDGRFRVQKDVWLYCQDHDAEELKKLLPGIEFSTAIKAIEIISSKNEDKLMYDQSEKAQRDYEWALEQ